MADKDWYAGLTEETSEKLKRAQFYVELALERGDVAIMEKVGEVIIKVRIPKKEKENA